MLKIYTIYDTKAEAYQRPFFAQSNAAAIRSITDACNDSEHPLAQHPEDYSVFLIGDWSEDTGTILAMSKFHICDCIDLKSDPVNKAQLSLISEQAQ